MTSREDLTSWTTERASSQVSLTPFKTQEMLLNHSKQQFANAVKLRENPKLTAKPVENHLQR